MGITMELSLTRNESQKGREWRGPSANAPEHSSVRGVPCGGRRRREFAVFTQPAQVALGTLRPDRVRVPLQRCAVESAAREARRREAGRGEERWMGMDVRVAVGNGFEGR